MLSNLNYLAIIVSSVIYFILGAVWFGPLFGKLWLKLTGLSLTEEDKKSAPFMFAKTFILDFIITFSVAILVNLIQPITILSALKISLLIGVGFVVAPFFGNFMYAKRSIKLFFIEAGYHVFCITISAIILTIWN
jgi:hypothetical protein